MLQSATGRGEGKDSESGLLSLQIKKSASAAGENNQHYNKLGAGLECHTARPPGC